MPRTEGDTPWPGPSLEPFVPGLVTWKRRRVVTDQCPRFGAPLGFEVSEAFVSLLDLAEVVPVISRSGGIAHSVPLQKVVRAQLQRLLHSAVERVEGRLAEHQQHRTREKDLSPRLILMNQEKAQETARLQVFPRGLKQAIRARGQPPPPVHVQVQPVPITQVGLAGGIPDAEALTVRLAHCPADAGVVARLPEP